MKNNKYACGIDFGTTNSTIGVVSSNTPPHIINIENDKNAVPTALFFEDKKTVPLFGQNAINHYINGYDGRFIRSIKRILGTDLMDKFTIINNKAVKFDELIRLFLSHLKKNAEENINTELSSVVIGRPVHFQDDDDEADKKAEDKLREIAGRIGFKDIAFQYEPIAAAFSHECNLTQEKLALVVDLGGGTSDFTIIRLGPGRAQKHERKDDILATSGVRIGGNDFDKALSMKAFMPAFGKESTYGEKSLTCPVYLFSELSEWSKINFAYTQKNLYLVESILNESHAPEKLERLLHLLEFEEAHRLLKKVEDAKIDLTDNENVAPTFESFKETIHFNANKTAFEKSIQNDIIKIELSMRDCLTQAGLTNEDINLVILTGGSCEIPIVQQTFRKLFPDAEFSEKEKLLSVGIGLTYAARRLL